MTDMRRHDHVMAGMEIDGVRVALDAETGPTTEHEDPFVRVLLEPLARGRDMAGRYDPLDTHSRRAEEDVGLFGWQASGQVVENVAQAVSIASRFLSRAGLFW